MLAPTAHYHFSNTAMPPIGNLVADTLKAQARAYYDRHNYAIAKVKYTETIDFVTRLPDGAKALVDLYGYRASCSGYLEEHMDMFKDLAIMTTLDGTYRPMVRLAKTLAHHGFYEFTKTAWSAAISRLPNTAFRSRKRRDFEVACSAATEEYHARMDETSGPWDNANMKIPWLRNQLPMNTTSSAWVISAANASYSSAIIQFGAQKFSEERVVHSNGAGMLDMLTAILLDFRAMGEGISEIQSIVAEMQTRKGPLAERWARAASEFVIEDALVYQVQEGWDIVQRALATTIMSWIAQGPGHVRRSIHVLAGLRTKWAHFSQDDRGPMFDEGFIFALRGFHIRLLRKAHEDYKVADDKEKSMLEDLGRRAQELSEELVRVVDADGFGKTLDPVTRMAFYEYPLGYAYAVLGYYNRCKAERWRTESTITKESMLFDKLSFDAFVLGAESFPIDDEMRASILFEAVKSMRYWNASEYLVKEYCSNIRGYLEVAETIWRSTECTQILLATVFDHEKWWSGRPKTMVGT
ncbi:hypothetical protein B0H10DRAFT_404194 [Mycena sp. CBHHK59/15]|nr:hypothetical protein B0H10DRAFT_404194 [Mycena sp. CBHHK59/15]